MMVNSGVFVESGTVVADPNTTFVDYPNPYRPPGLEPSGAEASLSASLSQVEAALAERDVACVMCEPILADGGMVVPPRGFLSALEGWPPLQHALGVRRGEGRLGPTGSMHAFQIDGATPDPVCFGKVLGNGCLFRPPLGRRRSGRASWSAPSTTAGNPICTAVARAVLKVLQEEELPERAAGRARGYARGWPSRTANVSVTSAGTAWPTVWNRRRTSKAIHPTQCWLLQLSTGPSSWVSSCSMWAATFSKSPHRWSSPMRRSTGP